MPSASQKTNLTNVETRHALSLQIAEAIKAKGYIVLDNFVPFELTTALLGEYQKISQDSFKKAGVGKQNGFQVNADIRSDQIFWLEKENTVINEYLKHLEELRLVINENLFLGLFDFEVHFAHYPVGSFYKKHVDAFKGSSVRVLSSVFYLNPEWKNGDGGELLLYSQENESILETITPTLGKQVFFLSKIFPHEVLEAKKPRQSLTGWFRANDF